MTRKAAVLFIFVISMISLISGCSSQSVLYAQGSQWKPFSPAEISLHTLQIQQDIPDYYRPIESTYLIFPEWYIVYSSQEYANYLKYHRPSGFPYFAAISQYWWSYHAADKLIKDRFPYNMGDHVMLIVIGSSLSAEYFIKGLYENTVGRTTEWLSSGEPTAEDRYAQKTAQQYAEFIPVYPWYEFSFSKHLLGLWRETPLWGPHMIRKLERRFILSVEYSFKALYASLIAVGTHMTYGTASASTYALMENTTPSFFKHYPRVRNVKSLNSQENIVSIPSEQPFTDVVINLTDSSASFKNIAGNNEILVTAIAPRHWHLYFNNSQLLFTMAVLTEPKLQRIGVRVPVISLITFLQYLQHNHIQIEHIYDY